MPVLRIASAASRESVGLHRGTSAAVVSSLLLACASIGCDSSTTGQDQEAAGSDAEDDFKGCPQGVPDHVEPGLQVASEHFSLTLIEAMPAEPERYSDNRWVVELSTRAGAPDAQIVRGQTFMPIHGHDGRVEPELTALSAPGQFQVDRLSFTMRGPWEVRLWSRSASVAEELAVFTVCVAK